MASVSKTMEKLLERSTVHDLVRNKDVLFAVKGDTTVQTALRIMEDRSIHALPVVDPKKDDDILGIVGIADIAEAVAYSKCFAEFESNPRFYEKYSTKSLSDLLKNNVLKQPIKDLLGLTCESKALWAFRSSETVSEVAIRFSKGVHRAIVKREKEEGGTCIVTQVDVVRFLYERLIECRDKNPEVSKMLLRPLSSFQSIKDSLNDPEKKTVSMTVSESALAGFRRLLQYQSYRNWNFSALPIVADEKDKRKNGTVIGTLSNADLRGITEDTLDHLLWPVGRYLRHKTGRIENKWPITVDESTPINSAIDQVVRYDIHRVWIVDSSGLPKGVFSLSDILALLLNIADGNEDRSCVIDKTENVPAKIRAATS